MAIYGTHVARSCLNLSLQTELDKIPFPVEETLSQELRIFIYRLVHTDLVTFMFAVSRKSKCCLFIFNCAVYEDPFSCSLFQSTFANFQVRNKRNHRAVNSLYNNKKKQLEQLVRFYFTKG